LVSRCLEDMKNGLGIGLGLEIKVFVLILVLKTRSPAIAEGPRDAGVPVEIW